MVQYGDVIFLSAFLRAQMMSEFLHAQHAPANKNEFVFRLVHPLAW